MTVIDHYDNEEKSGRDAAKAKADAEAKTKADADAAAAEVKRLAELETLIDTRAEKKTRAIIDAEFEPAKK